MRTRAAVALCIGCVMQSYAQVSMSVDVLDADEQGAPSPPGIIVADVYVDLTDGDSWTAGGIVGETHYGARMRYATDPNTGYVVVVNPGTADPFVTMFSKPRGRAVNARFTNGGAALAGRYSVGMATALFTPIGLDAAYFASPPETAGSPTVDGYVIRIALDVTNVSLPGAPFPNSAYFAAPLGDEPEGSIPVFESESPWVPGTANASFNHPSIEGTNWAIFVPEPTTLALLLLPLAVVRRR